MKGGPRSGSLAQKRELEHAFAKWIHHSSEWTHFVTLTFHRRTPCGQPVTNRMVEDALRHLFRSLSCKFYGKHRVNRGQSIFYVTVLDWGSYGDHPHAHILFKAPNGTTFDEFSSLIDSKANRIRLCNRERRIRPYLNFNGARYLVEHGIDRMVVSLFCLPSHRM